MINIDTVTYQINDINYHKIENDKSQIILARSLRKNNYHITRLKQKDFFKTKTWNTYTISRDGIVYQHYDNKYYSDFIGIKDVDIKSISIVLENMGSLFKTNDETYINWLNEICDSNNVKMKNWLGYKFWENIPAKQLKNTILLSQKLCDEHNILKKSIEFEYYHKETTNFNGIVFKSNYFENSRDVHPLFNIQNFNKLLVK